MQLMRDNPNLLDDSANVPTLNIVVGGSIFDHEIICLLDGKLARWSSASCVPQKIGKNKG